MLALILQFTIAHEWRHVAVSLASAIARTLSVTTIDGILGKVPRQLFVYEETATKLRPGTDSS